MSTTTYSNGTITVGANSTSVAGSGTAWLTSGLRAGDLFVAAGLAVPIASINSNTSMTLARPWPGAALSASNYDVLILDDQVRSLMATNDLLQKLTGGTLTSLGSLEGTADKVPYFNGPGSMALADLTPAGRALTALKGATGAKVPVVTGLNTAALRDIVGTASQFGAAFIERGSNANGEYVKFADGTLECWAEVSVPNILTLEGNNFHSEFVQWPFPHAFPNNSIVIVTAGSPEPNVLWVQSRAWNGSTAQIRILSNLARDTPRRARYHAIGRWF